MTLSEQAAVLLEATNDELLQPGDIVRWADTVIVAMEKPPDWVIDLSTLRSPHLADFVRSLREQATLPMSVRRQIQIVVLAHDAGLLSLPAALPKLFQIAILDCDERPLDQLGERLRDRLIEWDCQEDLDVIEPPLKAKFEALFRDYLGDSDEIAAIIPWKFQKVAEQDGPADGSQPIRVETNRMSSAAGARR